MSVKDIVIRSLCGYIFMLPGVLLYFWWLKKRGGKQLGTRVMATLVFCYYLIGVMTMTGIHAFRPFSPRVVWIPFLDMMNGPMDAALNVILFLPFGFFLPLLYESCAQTRKIVLMGASLSLVIELVQMFGMGTTDINDLITNTVGAYLGGGIYKMLSKLAPNGFCEQFRASKVNGQGEVLVLLGYALLIMVTVQPLVMHGLFRLG